jgi:hypothetical protein
MTMKPKTKRKRNRDPEQSDGEVAWRNRYIDLYAHVCKIYDTQVLALEAIDRNDPTRAADLLTALTDEYEEDVRKLCGG